MYRTFYDSSKKLFTEKTILKEDERPYSYLWPLCAFIQAANEMEAVSPSRIVMKPVIEVINKYYSPKKAPHPGYDSYPVPLGGGDRFYDDNQWIGIAYIDAYHRTKDKEYLRLSKEIYDYMMTGYDTTFGGGLYWKEFDTTTKNTCSNGPGVVLALELYKATKEKKYLDTALLLFDWVNKHLLSPEGLYYDAIQKPGWKIDKRQFTYNTGTMLQSYVLLYHITKKPEYLKQAQAIAKSSLPRFYQNGLFPDNFWFNAVLLRGYVELYKVDKDRQYVQAFRNYVDKVWETQRDEKGFIGKRSNKTLIDQSAYIELLARLQQIN
ncbi:MAG: glycoside hydrolase family 88 protein [Chitinophagaceae bacterium]|nr:glycoside hydrolase family 88 protein [Chitinophagaceae bacterium]